MNPEGQTSGQHPARSPPRTGRESHESRGATNNNDNRQQIFDNRNKHTTTNPIQSQSRPNRVQPDGRRHHALRLCESNELTQVLLPVSV